MIAVVRQRLRIRYRKDDVLMWIGHLDLMRLISRLLRRISAPIATSGKFSPKPRLTLGPPLSVGVSADAELADFELQEDVIWDADRIAEATKSMAQAALPRDFVVDLTELTQDAPTIAQAAQIGRYRIELGSPATQAQLLLDTGELTVTERDGKSVLATKGILTTCVGNNFLMIDGRAAGSEVFNVSRLSRGLEHAGCVVLNLKRCGLLDKDGNLL